MNNSSDAKPSPFDDYALQYDAALTIGLSASGEGKEFFSRGRVNWLAPRLAKLRVTPGQILDFGCGTGGSTPCLLALPGARQLLGVDVSARSVDVANQTHGSDRARFELLGRGRPAESVDLAYCNGVFHHIPPKQRRDAMAYIYRCVRPGGILALWENNGMNPGTRYVMSRIPFDRNAITLTARSARQLVRASGFRVVSTNFLFIFPRWLGWLRSFEPAVSGLPLGAQYVVLCRKPS